MQSRNEREGHYCGYFRPNGHADLPRRHYRQRYGTGCFITLKEYGRLQKRAARLGVGVRER